MIVSPQGNPLPGRNPYTFTGQILRSAPRGQAWSRPENKHGAIGFISQVHQQTAVLTVSGQQTHLSEGR